MLEERLAPGKWPERGLARGLQEGERIRGREMWGPENLAALKAQRLWVAVKASR
jgi:hypothetical protein